MTPAEIEAWALAYIEFQETWDPGANDHPLFWACERFMFLPNAPSVDDCWLAILEVLRRSSSEEVLGTLAAGPLEDLIHFAGPEVVTRIEAEARHNPSFRRLLLGVYESSTPAVWSRIEAARTNSL